MAPSIADILGTVWGGGRCDCRLSAPSLPLGVSDETDQHQIAGPDGLVRDCSCLASSQGQSASFSTWKVHQEYPRSQAASFKQSTFLAVPPALVAEPQDSDSNPPPECSQ